MSHNEYQQILTATLPQVYSSRFFFHQDGARAHTSVSTMNYFVEKQNQMRLNFPSHSPDLTGLKQRQWKIVDRIDQAFVES